MFCLSNEMRMVFVIVWMRVISLFSQASYVSIHHSKLGQVQWLVDIVEAHPTNHWHTCFTLAVTHAQSILTFPFKLNNIQTLACYKLNPMKLKRIIFRLGTLKILDKTLQLTWLPNKRSKHTMLPNCNHNCNSRSSALNTLMMSLLDKQLLGFFDLFPISGSLDILPTAFLSHGEPFPHVASRILWPNSHGQPLWHSPCSCPLLGLQPLDPTKNAI